MTTWRFLIEEKSRRLPVVFSTKITHNMDVIEEYNQDRVNELSQWYEYIEGLQSYISNPVIAWDYTNRYPKFPNGAKFIRDFNYNIGYTVKTNQSRASVYVFKINFNLQGFGLRVPPTLKENQIQNSNNTMKYKKVIRLTESDLHNIINEAVKEALNELDPRTYSSAATKARERGDYRRMGKFKNAAIDAWNKKFADPINAETNALPKRGIRHYYSMEDNDGYNIAINSQNYKTGETSSRDYTFDNDGKEYEWDELGNQYEGNGDFGVHNSIKQDGMDVARQMARGNGKYILGKGWQ